MATYLPNVKTYVPQTETFTPDYKFLNDVLSIRQDRYDSNYKQMNNLYGSVVHADVSREDSKNTRDQYVNQLAPKLQQISGLDLSLQQNVDAAKGLFKPFYEDKNLVRDIVFTKKWKAEMANAEKMKNSNDETTVKKYWETGVKKLQYDMEDFVNASSEDMMNTALPQYVNRFDMMGEGLAKIKELDPNVQEVSFTKNGQWKITMKNGSLLTRHAVGENKEGEMQYSNPIGDYLSASLLNDPRALEYYRTMGYVKARSHYDKDKEQYSDKQAGMNAWGDQFIEKYGTEEQKIIAKLEQRESVLKKHTISWANHIKEYGFIEGSDTDESIKNANVEYDVTVKSKDIRKERERKLKEGPSDNLTQALGMFISMHMLNDINTTANVYASTHGEVEMDINQFKLEEVKQQNRVALEYIKDNIANGPEAINTGKTAQQIIEEGSGLNSSQLEDQHPSGMEQANAIAQASEFAEDDYTKLAAIKDWYIQKNTLSGSTLNGVEQCYDGECQEVPQDTYITYEEVESELAAGNTIPLDNAYQNMVTEFEILQDDPTATPMGVHQRSDLLYSTGRTIAALKARELEHIEGQNLWDAAAVKQEVYVIKNDTGSYADLVEELGIGLFSKDGSGKTVHLSRSQFADQLVESSRFDDYLQKGTVETKTLYQGYGFGSTSVSSNAYSQPENRFHTFKDVADQPPGNPLVMLQKGYDDAPTRIVSFSEEGARTAADVMYDSLIKEMNEIGGGSTGHPNDMPVFNMAAFYDLEGQTGVGDQITNWSGGVYDHALEDHLNGGLLQANQLVDMLRKNKGEMIAVYGGFAKAVPGGELTDVLSSEGITGDLRTLQTHLGLSYDAEKSKESRPQFTIRYNPNGPVFKGENEEETRYSVYEVMLDPTYAKTFGQPSKEAGIGDESSTVFQRNDFTMSIFIPRGDYPNSADGGSRKHTWQRSINGGVNPIIGHPMAGDIEVSRLGGDYWATMSYRTYDPKAHKWVTNIPETIQLTDVDEYDDFNFLENEFDLVLQQRALVNYTAFAKDNQENQVGSEDLKN